MRWQVLAALGNGWLWLLAVLSVAVLLIAGAPLWFTALTGVAVLAGGAGVQGAVEWRAARRRRLPGGDASAAIGPADVRDPQAVTIIRRAHAATARMRATSQLGLDAPTDVLAGAEVAADGAVDTLNDLGRQVDRLDRALQAVDPRRVQEEMARVEASLADDTTASTELRDQRHAIAESLRAQLAAHQRLNDQRTLALTRMQSAAVGLEGLAVRLSEVTALYAARHDDAMTSADLASVADDVDRLRSDLVEAEASLRESLRSLD
jgi:hypothetical protein